MNIREAFNPEECFFTSDLHFFHENIIKFCHRPFYNTHEMNAQLIINWNEVVPPNANVFVAGDMFFTANQVLIKEVLDSLNGKIWLILGNHCYKNRFDRPDIMKLFDGRVCDTLHIKVKDIDEPQELVQFFISHYPHMYWQRGCYHLHGHVHSGPNSTACEVVPFHYLRYDIGVDNNNYTPISYYQLKDILNKQKEQYIESL